MNRAAPQTPLAPEALAALRFIVSYRVEQGAVVADRFRMSGRPRARFAVGWRTHAVRRGLMERLSEEKLIVWDHEALKPEKGCMIAPTPKGRRMVEAAGRTAS